MCSSSARTCRLVRAGKHTHAGRPVGVHISGAVTWQTCLNKGRAVDARSPHKSIDNIKPNQTMMQPHSCCKACRAQSPRHGVLMAPSAHTAWQSSSQECWAKRGRPRPRNGVQKTAPRRGSRKVSVSTQPSFAGTVRCGGQDARATWRPLLSAAKDAPRKQTNATACKLTDVGR